MSEPIRILYAEDNPQDVDLTRARFQREGPAFRLEFVDLGAVCLRRLASETFDALLLDHHLPDLDGLDVLARLRAEGRALPVVMVTGTGDDELVLRALRAGAQDYVPKVEGYLEALPGLLRALVEDRRRQLDRAGAKGPRPLRVLCIEPNPMDVDLTLDSLKASAPHLHLQAVPSFDEALALLGPGHPFGLVLMDLRVQGMSALEFLHEARHRGIEGPFIVISGKGDEATAVALLQLGASDYLVKRENYLTQLPFAIDHALRRHDLDRAAQRLHAELAALNASLERTVAARTLELEREVEARRISEEQFRTLAEHLPDLVLRLDPGLRCVYANPAAEAQAGRALRDDAGRLTGELIPDPGEAARWRAAVAGVFRSGEQAELTLSWTEASRTLSFEAVLAPERAPEGGVRSVIAVVRDVTGRKRAEAEQQRLEAQLRASQKMEALGTLAGGIAHDFNNIITLIHGNAELLEQALPLDAQASRHLDYIRKASDRARDLVRRIMAFSRGQVLGREVQKLGPVVSESILLLRSSLPPGVALTSELLDSAPAVLADGTQIQEVLFNLCTNAWQAMAGRGGNISVRLAETTVVEGPAGQKGDLPPGHYACLEVMDDGPGMAPAILERVFEPFFTTKAPGEGTGLGLAMVQSILRGHGADLRVQSTPGLGSAFRVYFPAVAEAPPAQDSPAATARPEPGQGQQVLYLDGDEALVVLMTSLLEQQGYRVSGYTDARKALRALRQHPDRIDLVVTDAAPPHLSGLEVAREVRAIRPGLPVLLAAGCITEAMAEQARSEGIRDVILKPDAVKDLGGLVQRLLAEHRVNSPEL